MIRSMFGRVDKPTPWPTPKREGQRAEIGIFESDAYAALGRYGQTIYVSPEHDLIVVTAAELDGNHDPILDLIDEFVLPAVVE